MPITGLVDKSPAPQATSLDRNKAFDGVRGYAALVVIVFHCVLGFDYGIRKSITEPVSSISNYYAFAKFFLATFSGHTAVNIFFVVSGCVLILSSQRCLQVGNIRGNVVFLIRRTFRILPLLIICVATIAAAFWALSFVFPQIISPYPEAQVLDNLLLASNKVHGASWTLRVEILAIPAMAIAGFLHKKVGTAGLAFFLLFSILAYENAGLTLGHPDLGTSLIYFSLGALIPTEVGAAVGRLRVGIWVVIAAMLYERSIFMPYDGLTVKFAQAGLCFWFLCQVFYGQSRAVTAFLSRPVSVFLGKISYSVYLWNVLFLNALFAFRPLFPAWTPDHAVLVGSIASIAIGAVTIPVAILSERYIEQPFILLGKRIEGLFLHLTRGRPGVRQAVPES
ncbi:MAG: acyltransferase [Azospirillaceae bacterium]|nr:acyltransferase [Azospirillaceae bacterium]